jgi:hypothetical protein
MSSISRRELVYALMKGDGLTEKQAANFANDLFKFVDKNRFSHSGLSAHDGYVEHSHEVRPDHDGVERQVPDNCTHGFDKNGEYTVRQLPKAAFPVRTKADDIAQAKAMREGEAREGTRPVTLAEFQAQNTMQGLTITGIIEEIEALKTRVANGPNAPYTN